MNALADTWQRGLGDVMASRRNTCDQGEWPASVSVICRDGIQADRNGLHRGVWPLTFFITAFCGSTPRRDFLDVSTSAVWEISCYGPRLVVGGFNAACGQSAFD